ncbi:MAG: 2-succinyl-5-enolpyruvyl-6-hydroxy-3-cyclohexene-1-carboxylate synthase [Eubacteriales bacterium]
MEYINNKILVAFLKRHGIKKIVLSSGSRNIPFISAVEVDEDFECFSVVDERNAAFFGMGLAQESKELVAIACTSGTAVSNYVSGVSEAFYSNVPLVVITFDRSPYVLNQLETQKIDQMSLFDSITKKNINLPVIKDEEDVWYCQRILNEAFIALKNNGGGPIHINVPLIGDANDMMEDGQHKYGINDIKFIDYYDIRSDFEDIYASFKGKNILFVFGQDIVLSDDEKSIIREFVEKYNIPVLTDSLSNFKSSKNINASRVIKGLNSKTIQKYLPDIVITCGLNFQERTKDLLKANARLFEHWAVCEDGVIRDCFKSQTKIIHTRVTDLCNQIMSKVDAYDTKYYEKWKKLDEHAVLPELPYSNFSVIGSFLRIIPNNSLLHLSILNATRLAQFFEIDESVRVYSNVNTFGIDGNLPTFLGQAYCTDDLSFIVVGDLSFFYAMNALQIRHIKNNVRILVVNNFGGGEFYISPGASKNKTIDLHIGAKHTINAEGWAISAGFKYLSVRAEDELDDKLKTFVGTSDKPIVLEAFTETVSDGQVTLNVYRKLEEQLGDL